MSVVIYKPESDTSSAIFTFLLASYHFAKDTAFPKVNEFVQEQFKKNVKPTVDAINEKSPYAIPTTLTFTGTTTVTAGVQSINRGNKKTGLALMALGLGQIASAGYMLEDRIKAFVNGIDKEQLKKDFSDKASAYKETIKNEFPTWKNNTITFVSDFIKDAKTIGNQCYIDYAVPFKNSVLDYVSKNPKSLPVIGAGSGITFTIGIDRILNRKYLTGIPLTLVGLAGVAICYDQFSKNLQTI